jgi:two-component system cell cycle sensor histidine kinase/response regulator CckA
MIGHRRDHSPSPRILLVEDETPIRKLIFEILTNEGYELIAFPDGLEAYEWLQAHPEHIDLVITDIQLPGISGKELADRICRLQPDTKILFLSGYSSFSASDLNRCSNTDRHFMTKPFKLSELLVQVERVIGPKAVRSFS